MQSGRLLAAITTTGCCSVDCICNECAIRPKAVSLITQTERVMPQTQLELTVHENPWPWRTCNPSISCNSWLRMRSRTSTPSLPARSTSRSPTKPSSSSKKMIDGLDIRALQGHCTVRTSSPVVQASGACHIRQGPVWHRPSKQGCQSLFALSYKLIQQLWALYSQKIQPGFCSYSPGQ